MSEALHEDFLNLQLCTRKLASTLTSTPHVLTDNFGNVLLSHAAETTAKDGLDIELRGKVVAKLRAQPELGVLLKVMVEAALDAELRASDALSTLEEGQLVANDLDALLDLSENDTIPIADLLSQFLRLMRAHVWVERASIFGLLDGFTLEGLGGIGWPNDDWKKLYSTAAAVAANTKKPYIVEDPAKDKFLKDVAEAHGIRNLVCFPLIHGTTLVGVMNMSNRVGGPFSGKETQVVKSFANVAAHLLQKQIFKIRMEEFRENTEKISKYVDKKVAKDVKEQGEIHLGGKEKKVVCLFSDIRGYTSITEGLSPEKLVGLLNFHFERMHEIIAKHEGAVDKMVGDLVMAVWNFPKDQPDPELLAMKCALEMQKEMIRVVLPEWQRNGVENVGMGVGVNAGIALVGNLGSSRFMNYTVIGDAINTAQRLESKAQKGEIWMAETMYPAVHGKIQKPADRKQGIKLKGKEQTVNALVYKPLSY